MGGGSRERAEPFSSEKKGDLLERGGQGKLYLNTVKFSYRYNYLLF